MRPEVVLGIRFDLIGSTLGAYQEQYGKRPESLDLLMKWAFEQKRTTFLIQPALEYKGRSLPYLYFKNGFGPTNRRILVAAPMPFCQIDGRRSLNTNGALGDQQTRLVVLENCSTQQIPEIDFQAWNQTTGTGLSP